MTLHAMTIYARLQGDYVTLWHSPRDPVSYISIPAQEFAQTLGLTNTGNVSEDRWYSLQVNITDAGPVTPPEDTSVDGAVASRVLGKIAGNKQAATTLRWEGDHWTVTVGDRSVTGTTIKQALEQLL